MFSMKPRNFYLPLFMVFLIGLNSVYLNGAPFKKKDLKCININYKISVDFENKGYFSIKAVISGIQTESLLLRMTANYGRVEELNDLVPSMTISSNGDEIRGIEKINEFLWEIPINSSEVEIDYSINTHFPYSSLNQVRLPFRDENHLYFPASSAFIYPDEQYLDENNIKIHKIGIRFDLPPGWVAATSWGTGKISLELDPPSLDTLIAGLIGLGTYSFYSFTVNDFLVETAILSHEGKIQDFEVNQAIEQGLNSAYNLFRFFPISRFFALVHFIFEQPGRLNGNALGWSINVNCGRSLNRSQWLEIMSHLFAEIFHLWNGTEGPPLSRAQNDHSLIWFTEGVTNFYRLKNMATSGLMREEEYYRFLSDEFNKIFHSSRCGDKLDRLSQDYYTDREAMILTYSKGCCVAFVLDLLIKKISLDQRSFDDILKLMIKRYNYKENGHTYSHKEVDEVIKEILGDKHFPSYKKLYGKDFVPEFESILKRAGLSIQKKKGRRLYFGILNFGPPGGPVKVLSVDHESPSYAAGLRSGDVLLEINGKRIKSSASIKELVRNIPENMPIELTLERSGKRLQITTSWNSYATEFVISKKGGLEK